MWHVWGWSILFPSKQTSIQTLKTPPGLRQKFLVDVKPGPMSNKITVLDVDQNEILHEVDVPQAICDLELTADGQRLVLVGDSGVFLVDTATWKILPMQLIMDSFSHAPAVNLSEQGQMGLDVTGYRPVSDVIQIGDDTNVATESPK